MQLTPYTADSIHRWASHFARKGFAFLAVNCRGRGGSEGKFKPFRYDGNDGHDVVEWVPRNEWSDGRVVMSGGSYAGYTQWATAARNPRHLKAIAPIASAYPGWDFPRPGGILPTYLIRWLAFVNGASSNDQLFGDANFWKARLRDALRSNDSIARQADILGTSRRMFDELLRQLDREDYWQRLVPTAREYAAMRIPVLTVSGQYDGDQPGALRYYAAHLRHTPRASRRHDLVIGPWDHAGTRYPEAKFGGLRFSRKSVFDMRDFLCDWYRWALDDAPRPQLLKSRVALYVVGAERWCHGANLGAVLPRTRDFFPAASASAAQSLATVGALSQLQPRRRHVASFRREPRDTRDGEIELKVEGFAGGQRTAAVDGSGLVFVSKPFRRPLTLMGRPTLIAWMRIDTPDVDFYLWIEEVRRNGRVHGITRDLLRARHRRSLFRSDPVIPGTWERYEFPGLHFIARRLGVGSRLRLVLTSPVSPFLQRNPNTYGTFDEKDLARARPVHVELALGGARACRLRFQLTPSASLE